MRRGNALTPGALAGGALAGALLLTGCTVQVTPAPGPTTTQAPTGSPTTGNPTTPGGTSPGGTTPAAPTAASGDLADPCTLLPADVLNAQLGTDFGDGTTADDAARQIVTCRYQSDDLLKIVGVSVSKIDGQKSFDLNRKLAEAYFSGKPQPTTVAGADKAYLVIAETLSAPVIGMLVRGHFVLVQVGVEGATPQQAQALAAEVAARVP